MSMTALLMASPAPSSHTPLSLNLKTLSWVELSDADRLSCVGFAWDKKICSKYAWDATGHILEVWNKDVYPRIKGICAANAKEIYQGKSIHQACSYHLYLLCSSQNAEKAIPTIVAKSQDSKAAKRAIKVIKGHKAIQDLKLCFSYAVHKEKLVLTADTVRTSSDSQPQKGEFNSLCGARVLVSPFPTDPSSRWRRATIGGVLCLDGQYYATTVAHCFLDNSEYNVFDAESGQINNGQIDNEQIDDEQSDDEQSDNSKSDGSENGSGTSAEQESQPDTNPPLSYPKPHAVYLENCTTDASPTKREGSEILTDLPAPGNLTLIGHMFPTTSTTPKDESFSSSICYELDWALVHIQDPRFMRRNEICLPEKVIRLNSFNLNQEPPQGNVIIASGASGLLRGPISGARCGMVFPWSSEMQDVWTVNLTTVPGDCGAWVISESGCIYGVAVATDHSSKLTYVIPAESVFASIVSRWKGANLAHLFPQNTLSDLEADQLFSPKDPSSSVIDSSVGSAGRALDRTIYGEEPNIPRDGFDVGDLDSRFECPEASNGRVIPHDDDPKIPTNSGYRRILLPIRHYSEPFETQTTRQDPGENREGERQMLESDNGGGQPQELQKEQLDHDTSLSHAKVLSTYMGLTPQKLNEQKQLQLPNQSRRRRKPHGVFTTENPFRTRAAAAEAEAMDRKGHLLNKEQLDQWEDPSSTTMDTHVTLTSDASSSHIVIKPEDFTAHELKDDHIRVRIMTPVPMDFQRSDESTGLKKLTEKGTPSAGYPALLGVSNLQDYVRELEFEAETLRAELGRLVPSRWQILYRLHKGEHRDRNASQLYLDHPKWIIGRTGQKTLECTIPVWNFELYLERNKDIAFFVFKDFDRHVTFFDNNKPTYRDTIAYLPLAEPFQESIEPVSPELVSAVRTLLESDSALSAMLSHFRETHEILAPYLCIYHNREKLDLITESLPSSAKEQFNLLAQYVYKAFSKEYDEVDELIRQGLITVPYMKYLFRPNELLIHEGQRAYMATAEPEFGEDPKSMVDLERKIDERSATKSFVATFRVWSWKFHGAFQREHLKIVLTCTQSTVQKLTISALDVYPLRFANAGVIAGLRARGGAFWRCRYRRFVSYEGVGARDERYMVDMDVYKMLHPDALRGELRDDFGAANMALAEPPDPDFLLLLPPCILGFNMQQKRWLELEVSRIKPVSWNKEAFGTLVLPPNQKELILALVTNQLAAEKSTDMIRGKGNGLIMLLHGGPGTGKTLTAESVAEIAEKPLYRVTCGDIGTMPEEVEKYMEAVLHLSKTWDCVVLLDEADVFLQERSLQDLGRNALVSVFLRILEYHEGILFLTTNRVGIFDEAFKSRIQLALHYSPLGFAERRQIWRNFINRLGGLNEDNINFDDLKDRVDQFAETEMNGRQIRNCITTARELALFQTVQLNYHHLEVAIQAAADFEGYLKTVHENLADETNG